MKSAMLALIITIIGVDCENFAATKVLRLHLNAIIILKKVLLHKNYLICELIELVVDKTLADIG